MPGTIVVPEETFAANLRAVMAGFWNAGFRKQILFNGHGQDYVIPMAMHQFGKKYQVPMLLINVNYWFTIKEHIRDKAHGGLLKLPLYTATKSKPHSPWRSSRDDPHGRRGRHQRPELFPPATLTSPVLPTTCRFPSGSTWAPPPSSRWPPPRVWSAAPRWPILLKPLARFRRAGIHEKLVNDIMAMYPAGKLPPVDKVTQRSKEEIEALLKDHLKRRQTPLYRCLSTLNRQHS
jgi:creatinine amidohydrolase